MNTRNILLSLVALLFLFGCHQAHEMDVSGKTRPKIDEDEVRFYTLAPVKSEHVAYITAEAHQFTRSGRISNLIQELRSGAAEVGANGVVLNTSQITLTGGQVTSAPMTSEGAEAVLNTDENLHGEVIYVYADDSPPRTGATGASPAAPAVPAATPAQEIAPASSAQRKAGISYATVVVNDTGNPAENLAIANRTCHKLGKVAERDEVRPDGTITYLCVDE